MSDLTEYQAEMASICPMEWFHPYDLEGLGSVHRPLYTCRKLHEKGVLERRLTPGLTRDTILFGSPNKHWQYRRREEVEV